MKANTIPSAKKERQPSRALLFDPDALWASEGSNENVRIGIQKDQVHLFEPHTEARGRINEPEVNQTKPEQAAEGSKICADSAGYAPQA
jgi:hypothetical protein